MFKKALWSLVIGAAIFAGAVFIPWGTIGDVIAGSLPWGAVFGWTWKTFAGLVGALALVMVATKVIRERINVSRLPVLLWITGIVGALLYYWPTLGRLQLPALCGAAVLIALCFGIVQPFNGGIVTFLGRPVRSVGAGAVLLFRPFGIPFEAISDLVDLKNTALNDVKLRAETGGEAESGVDKGYVDLEVAFQYAPDPSNLIAYVSFQQDKLVQTLKDQLEALLSAAVERRPNVDAVYEELDDISRETLLAYEKVASRYGIIPKVVLMDDPQLPEETIRAKVARDNLKADALAKIEVQKSENARRQAEMTKVRQMAAGLVKEAAERGHQITFEQALERVQIQLGVVKKTINAVDIGPAADSALKQIVPMVVNRFGSEPVTVEKGSAYTKPRPGLDAGKNKK